MLLALLLACAEPPKPPPTIPDLWRPILRVNAGAAPGRPARVDVYFHPEEVGSCQPIPGIAAAVDGVPLTRLHGKVDQGGYQYDRDCNVFEFTAAVDAVRGHAQGGRSKVTVTDGTTTATAEIEHLLDERSLALVSPGPFARGEVVTLAWTPGGNVVDPKGRYGVTLRAGDDEVFVTPVTVLADTVQFTVPADLPEAYTGTVTAEFVGTAGVQPKVVGCVWAAACEVSLTYLVPPVALPLKP